MTIANTDKILVNRSGVSYNVEAQNFDDKAQATDILLVNRAGKSYKCTRADLDTKLLDDDILLITRNGKSYKVTGAEFKTLLTVLPEIASVTLTELTPNETRWTDQQFKWDCVMAEDGDPPSTRRITYYIEGKFAEKLITDTITGWDAGSKTLTFASDQDIAPMEVDDVIRQDETSITGTWQSFNADNVLNNLSGGANSALAQSETQTFVCVGNGTTHTTWVQRGPITNQGPWQQVEIPGITCRCAYVHDDVLYVFGNSLTGPVLAISKDGGKTFETNDILGFTGGTSINDFAAFNGKYYLSVSYKLYVSNSIAGPYTIDNRPNQLQVSRFAVTLGDSLLVISELQETQQVLVLSCRLHLMMTLI